VPAGRRTTSPARSSTSSSASYSSGSPAVHSAGAPFDRTTYTAPLPRTVPLAGRVHEQGSVLVDPNANCARGPAICDRPRHERHEPTHPIALGEVRVGDHAGEPREVEKLLFHRHESVVRVREGLVGVDAVVERRKRIVPEDCATRARAADHGAARRRRLQLQLDARPFPAGDVGGLVAARQEDRLGPRQAIGDVVAVSEAPGRHEQRLDRVHAPDVRVEVIVVAIGARGPEDHDVATRDEGHPALEGLVDVGSAAHEDPRGAERRHLGVCLLAREEALEPLGFLDRRRPRRAARRNTSHSPGGGAAARPGGGRPAGAGAGAARFAFVGAAAERHARCYRELREDLAGHCLSLSILSSTRSV
jgi:hypothetical protein